MDTPLELINGGHGVKNPLALDIPRPDSDKLPPVRYFPRKLFISEQKLIFLFLDVNLIPVDFNVGLVTKASPYKDFSTDT